MIEIRSACVNDAEEILKIYAPYIEKTAITFEYEVPSVADFAERIRATLEKYPYLVACKNGVIVGYAYAGAINKRAAYYKSAELSVYIAQECRGMGIGKLLYEELEKQLKLRGIDRLYALVAYCQEDTPYLTDASVKFHEHLGYKEAGHLHGCGCKFNTLLDLLILEKIL